MAEMTSLSASSILQNEASEERAENARLSCFVGAIAVGDLIKSTMGPKGMDKVLQSIDMKSEPIITNDGATILKSIPLDNPAAKILVDISKVQDEEIGDGTTSMCVFASELLRGAEQLIQKKIHPQIIISGYREATRVARDALKRSAVTPWKNDKEFREKLIQIAETTLSSKILNYNKRKFAEMTTSAMLRVGEKASLDHIYILKKIGGSLSDSFLDDGFILDKSIGVNQPKKIENANILLANTSMDTDKVKIFSTRVRVESTSSIAKLEFSEREKMREKVNRIKAHKINCFINRQLIYNYPEQLFADAGIMAIEHADFEGIERLALALDGEIVSTFDDPEKVKLGKCKLIEEIMIGEDKLIRFSGMAQPHACTIVIRGPTQQIVDEAERAIHDALCVLKKTIQFPSIVYGGGCSEVLMAVAVDQAATKIASKMAIAMNFFAHALIQLPTIIVDNAGLDSSDVIPSLRADHTKSYLDPSSPPCRSGLNLLNNNVRDMAELGILEPLCLKENILVSGAEAAEMILRVDNIIKTAPRKRASS